MFERGRNRLVPKEQAAAWQRWQAESLELDNEEPSAEPAEPELPPEPPPPDPQVILEEARQQGIAEGRETGHAEGLVQGRETGHAEGREAGFAEGLAAGQAEARREAEHLRALSERCAQAYAALEHDMSEALVTLGLDIARQVLRQEITTNHASMLGVVREILHADPDQPQGLRLWLHPDDIELVNEHLGTEAREQGWRLLADPQLNRGDCRAESPYGAIDATLQTRWQRVAAALDRNTPWDSQP